MRHHSTKNEIEDVLGVEFAPALVVEKETVARDSFLGLKQSRGLGKPVKVALNVKNLCDKHSSAKILCSDCLE